jgi:hypothetical protein
MIEPAPGPPTPRPQPSHPGKHALRWPEASTRLGATLYAIIGGLIVWFLVDILPHVHIAISWH